MIRRIKERVIFKYSKNYSCEFVNYSYHSLFMAFKLSVFNFVIGFKYFIPGYNSCCHLIKDIPEKRIALFRYSSFCLPFTRLFNNRISSSIFNKFFSISKFFNIFYFSKEKASQFFGNTFYRAKDVNLFFRGFRDFIFKSFFEVFNLVFKEEKLFDKELKGGFKSFMRDTNRGFSKGFNGLMGECGRSF